MLRILATTKSRLPRHYERSVAIHNLVNIAMEAVK